MFTVCFLQLKYKFREDIVFFFFLICFGYWSIPRCMVIRVTDWDYCFCLFSKLSHPPYYGSRPSPLPPSPPWAQDPGSANFTVPATVVGLKCGTGPKQKQ